MLHRRKQKGVAALLVTVVVLSVAIIVTLFTARIIITDQKIFKNVLDQAQAENAAQAGMQYGEAYQNYNYNYVDITDGQTVSATLPDGSSYVTTYATEVNSNTDVHRITSVGKSADNSSTRTITALFQWYSTALLLMPMAAINGHADIKVEDNSVITKAGVGDAAQSGKQIKLKTGGSVSPSYTENVQSLKDKTNSEFQTDYIGKLITDYATDAAITYTKTADYTFNSELNGVKGRPIYLNMNGNRATLSNAVLGSLEFPVTIFVDGSMQLTGSGVTVYGNIYATGTMDILSSATLSGFAFSLDDATFDQSATVTGGVLSGDKMFVTNNSTVTYNGTVIRRGAPGTITYNLLPGSWRDF